VSFFREALARAGCLPAAALKTLKDRRRLSVGGLVLVRQRPGTAKGVVFMTLEDETGIANIVIWKDAFEANRRLVMGASFIIVHGQLQTEGEVIHLWPNASPTSPRSSARCARTKARRRRRSGTASQAA
jgi:error-prone DNA polymerase